MRRLRVQFEIDRLAACRLLCPVGRGEFGAAQVLIDHRQFGVQIAIRHHDCGDVSEAELLDGGEAVCPGDDLLTLFPTGARRALYPRNFPRIPVQRVRVSPR